MSYHEFTVDSDSGGEGTGEQDFPESGYISRMYISPNGSADPGMTVTINESGGGQREIWSGTVGSTSQEFTPTQNEVDSSNADSGGTSLIKIGSRLNAVVAGAGGVLSPAVTISFEIDPV